jgi:ABC-type Fe3+/spermidine/putrescine transport system ATPase subunit
MSRTSPLLEVERLSSSWGKLPVLRSVSFSLEAGELLTVLGPNGSGKSTLLRLLAGFESPTQGAVRLQGKDLAGVPPFRRQIGLLFQEPALFPRRTVFENIAYAPLLQRRAEPEVRELVGRLSGLLSLDALLDRPPEQLSGGERQRVALARTLAARPKLVLLDEPFASVDVEIRGGLHAEFRSALRAFGTAAIHVTHDREEGLFLGDRLGLLFDGALEALGEPLGVYRHPSSVRAARFLGYNILGPRAEPRAVLPEALRPTAPSPETGRFVVRASGPVGRRFLAVLDGPDGERVELRSDAPLATGEVTGLEWTEEVLLPPEAPARGDVGTPSRSA